MTTTTTTTVTMTIHRYDDAECIGKVKLTPAQRTAYVRNEGPTGVIRFRDLHDGQYPSEYDLKKDYQDTQPDAFVYLLD